MVNRNPSELKTTKNVDRSSSYPRYGLKKAEELALKIFENGARNCDEDIIAKAVGYTNGKNGAYNSLKAAAKHFNLINYNSSRSIISVEDRWIDVLHSEDLAKLKIERKQSLQQPNLYQKIIEKYKDIQLPQLDKLSRELHLNPEYGILQNAAERAAKVFLESAEYAGIINQNGFIELENKAVAADHDENKEDSSNLYQDHSLVIDSQGKFQENTFQPQQKKILDTTDCLDNKNHPEEKLEKYEINLVNHKKVYIYAPVPLPYGEKERLKKYIDLMIEAPSSKPQAFNSSSVENTNEN